MGREGILWTFVESDKGIRGNADLGSKRNVDMRERGIRKVVSRKVKVNVGWGSSGRGLLAGEVRRGGSR